MAQRNVTSAENGGWRLALPQWRNGWLASCSYGVFPTISNQLISCGSCESLKSRPVSYFAAPFRALRWHALALAPA
jgi:hypothetical protein